MQRNKTAVAGPRMRKVIIVGAGFVGSTTAYSLLAANLVDEIALIDINAKLASSQTMDLQHALPFWSHCTVKVGTYADVKNSAIAIIACGANQKPGETRLDLIKKNSAIIADVVPRIFRYNPNIILIMVTNPVDMLTYQVIRMFHDTGRIIGSGTILDSARLRYLLGQYFKVNPQSIHAYIIGEHGDTEFPLWSTATIGNVSLSKFPGYNAKIMNKLFRVAKNAAYTIIAGKQATYYAIAAGVKLLVKAILGDENSVLPVSSLLTNYHGISDVCLSVPCVVGRSGIRQKLRLELNARELKLLNKSAAALKKASRFLSKQ